MGAIHTSGHTYFSHHVPLSAEITISSAGWSGTTETVSGVAYYTYTQQLSTISAEHPDISIGAAGTLPTAAEKAAYSCIDYATVEDEDLELKLYAQTKPTADFVIIVEGVAV